MSAENLTPQRAATRLFRIAETFSTAHGLPLFPLDITQLALGAADLFGWNDSITEVTAAPIKGFEGALFPNDERTKWMLLYNQALTSKGRVRFTQAHELGHFVLHRLARERFHCSQGDMLDWFEKSIEAEADLFASYLLMPLEDFRRQEAPVMDLDVLGACAERYGVSLTAAILKWISYTDQKAVFVMSIDGYINWARSSDPAFHAGAFFRTSTGPIEIPSGSVAADESVKQERSGIVLPASIWWPKAEPAVQVREMKISADQYDSVLTVLVLPHSGSVWGPWTGGRTGA